MRVALLFSIPPNKRHSEVFNKENRRISQTATQPFALDVRTEFFVGECYFCPLRRLCRHLSRGERLWSSVVWLFVLIALPCRGRPPFLSHRRPMLLAGALRDRFWGREQVRLAVRRRGVRRLWLLWLLYNMLCLIILFSYIATKSKKTIVFYL